MPERYDADRAGVGGALGVFLVFWSLFTVAGDCLLAWNVFRQIRANGYPSVEGRIIRSDLTVHWSEGSPTYAVDVQFAYTVNGIAHTGNRHRYRPITGKRKFIQDVLAALAPGRAVAVHYNPRDPSDAVLQPGVDGQDLFLFIVLSPFNAVMLAGWISHVRLRRTGSILENRFCDDGVVARATVDAWPPALAATVVAGVVGLALSILVGIPTGANLSVPVGAAMGIVVVIAAGLAWWHTNASRAGGAHEITIDRAAQMLTLPKLKGRSERMTVPFSLVTGVEVNDVGSDRDDKRCAVRAILRTADGNSMEKVTGPTDKKAAHRLADWLRERLRC